MIDPVLIMNTVPAFFSALSPFGELATVLGDIVICRTELKKIRIEARNIRTQYKMAKEQISAKMKIEIQNYNLRRLEIEKLFKYAEKNQSLHHIENMQRVSVIDQMTTLFTNPSTPLAEKELAQEAIILLSSDLVESQKSGINDLSILVGRVRKQLSELPLLEN